MKTRDQAVVAYPVVQFLHEELESGDRMVMTTDLFPAATASARVDGGDYDQRQNRGGDHAADHGHRDPPHDLRAGACPPHDWQQAGHDCDDRHHLRTDAQRRTSIRPTQRRRVPRCGTEDGCAQAVSTGFSGVNLRPPGATGWSYGLPAGSLYNTSDRRRRRMARCALPTLHNCCRLSPPSRCNPEGVEHSGRER